MSKEHPLCMDTPQAWEPPAQRNSQSLPFKPPPLLQPEKPLISSSLQRKLHFQRGVMEKCQLSGPSRKGSLVDLTVGEPKARTVTFRRTSQTHGIHVLYCCGEVCGWEGETHTQISACAFQICIDRVTTFAQGKPKNTAFPHPPKKISTSINFL